MLEFKSVGSVAVAEQQKDGDGGAYDIARRLVLDILVHHSPQDVQVAVLADDDEARSRWEWLNGHPIHALFCNRIVFAG